MARMEARLFGRFALSRDNSAIEGISATKVREMLCYLLLHHGRPHARERLASLLWPDTTTERSRKYLRQVVWQLQGALRSLPGARSEWLRVETDWVRLDVDAALEVDVLRFHAAVLAAAAHPGDGALPPELARRLEAAVELYRGPLLDGWYQDWCVRERERLQGLLLDALDMLAAHHEAGRRYALAQQWAARLLQHDGAHESAHQRLMRLHYLSGNRIRALRQFDECVTALAEELGVEPAAATLALRDRIRAGQCLVPGPESRSGQGLGEILAHLRALEEQLAGVQIHVREQIAAVERLSGETARRGAGTVAARAVG